MKIYPRILLNTLSLILAGFLFVGGLTCSLSRNAMSSLAERWLSTKLDIAFVAEILSVVMLMVFARCFTRELDHF